MTSRRGATLAEALLAISLLATALLLLMTVFSGGLMLMQRSNDLAAGSELAREELERIAMLPFGDLPATAAAFDGRVPDPQAAGFPPPPYPRGDYPLRVEIEPLAGGTARAVRVTVFLPRGGSVQLERWVHE